MLIDFKEITKFNFQSVIFNLTTLIFVLFLSSCTYKHTNDLTEDVNFTHFLKAGKSQIVFTDWAGPKLKIWIYRPIEVSENTPIVFVMHGTKRDGERYRDEWSKFAKAENFILIVPEFPRSDFPRANGYNLGNVVKGENGDLIPREQWAFSAIEPIFDKIKKMTENKTATYSMYGHSAGAQFVHRFVYFVPNARLTHAVAANAGWYTMPDLSVDFPYGLKGSGLSKEALNEALSSKLLVLLGTADTNPNHRTLRVTPEANAQGAHRYARGHSFVLAGKHRAKINQVPFNWSISYAPRIGHKNGQMASFASSFLTQDKTGNR